MRLPLKTATTLAAIVLAAVPMSSQASLDLTASCGLSGTIGNGIFSNPCNQDIVGTGVIQPFLTIQQNGSEGGFNTDFTPLKDVVAPSPYDANDAKRSGGGYTNSIKLGDIGTVTVGTVKYRQFFLDINESNNNDKYLSLDRLMISVGGTGNSGNLQDIFSLGLIYDLDAGGDTAILMNYDLNAGSGKGTDLSIQILDSLFGVDNNAYVNLFAEFGLTGKVGARDYGSSDGFEEFYVLKSAPVQDCTQTPNDPACQPPPTGDLPEPGSLALVALGLMGAGLAARRKKT